jgi:hypothetical protein
MRVFENSPDALRFYLNLINTAKTDKLFRQLYHSQRSHHHNQQKTLIVFDGTNGCGIGQRVIPTDVNDCGS